MQEKNLLITSPLSWPCNVLCYHAFAPLLSLTNLPCGDFPRALLRGPGRGGGGIWRVVPILSGRFLTFLLFR